MGARDRARGWWKRLRATLRRRASDDEMSAEMAFHLEMEVERNVQAGMAPREARRVARIAFGGVENFKEEVRAGRGFPWLESVLSDLALTLRGFRRSPGFACIAVLTLALGIGAATSIFAVVDAVLLRPLPFHEPDRLVHIQELNPEGADFTVSEPNYLDFREQGSSSALLAAYRVDALSLTGHGHPRLLTVGAVTASLFPVLGIHPVIGRGIGPDEDTPGGNRRVAVLGHELWTTAFASDSAIAGRTITLNDEPFTVVGVMPRNFRFPGVSLWVPLAPDPRNDRDDHWLSVIGRLAPGVVPERLQAELAAVSRRIGAAHPEVSGWGVRVGSLAGWVAGPSLQRSSVLLGAAVAVLLLLACVNVANLLLARAAARQTDLSIRIAMGAGRGRLLRQLLTESAVLAFAGAGVGLVGAVWVVGVVPRMLAGAVPGLDALSVSPRVLGFSMLAAVLATVAAGLVPALRASAVDIHATLKRAGRGTTAHGQGRLREILVVGQVALAVVLLVGGGLMMRSLLRLNATDTGFASEHVWAVPLQLPTGRYPEEWQAARFFEAVVANMEAIPGVRSVGGTSVDPFSGFNLVNGVTPENRATEHPGGLMQAGWRIVTPGYFAAAGVPVLAGRVFTADDRDGASPVAVVSRTLAERMWPGDDPLGQRLYWGGTEGALRTVVGVVGDISDVTVAGGQPVLFLSAGQLGWPGMTLIVRGSGNLPGLAEEVRRAVWAEDASLPVPAVRPVSESRARALATPRFSAVVLAAFGGAALLLSAIGLYGVLAATVAERTREIGIRMALGASPRRVVAGLVRGAVRFTLAGTVLGMLVAFGLTRLMASLLYRTPGTDPLVLGSVALLLLAVGVLAALAPATRATRVDPVITIRGE